MGDAEEAAAVTIQRHVRGFRARRHYARSREAAVTIQRMFRRQKVQARCTGNTDAAAATRSSDGAGPKTATASLHASAATTRDGGGGGGGGGGDTGGGSKKNYGVGDGDSPEEEKLTPKEEKAALTIYRFLQKAVRRQRTENGSS